MTFPWTTVPQTPSGAYPPQPNLTPRPFRVRIHNQRAVRVIARTQFDAVVQVLNRKGLRYAETRFHVEEVQP